MQPIIKSKGKQYPTRERARLEGIDLAAAYEVLAKASVSAHRTRLSDGSQHTVGGKDE